MSVESRIWVNLGEVTFATYLDSNHAMRWRLIAGNGRTVGISARSFKEETLAWADVQSLQGQADGLIANLSHPSSGIGWFWTASDSVGNAVAEGGRSYERRATCVQGFGRFQKMLPLVSLPVSRTGR